MAQWWEHLPPTAVAWVRLLDPASHVGWVCCWFSSLLRGFFFGFCSIHKINTSKIYFDLETVDEEPLRGNATANSIIIMIMIMIVITTCIYCILMVFTIILSATGCYLSWSQRFSLIFPSMESCERVAKQWTRVTKQQERYFLSCHFVTTICPFVKRKIMKNLRVVTVLDANKS